MLSGVSDSGRTSTHGHMAGFRCFSLKSSIPPQVPYLRFFVCALSPQTKSLLLHLSDLVGDWVRCPPPVRTNAVIPSTQYDICFVAFPSLSYATSCTVGNGVPKTYRISVSPASRDRNAKALFLSEMPAASRLNPFSCITKVNMSRQALLRTSDQLWFRNMCEVQPFVLIWENSSALHSRLEEPKSKLGCPYSAVLWTSATCLKSSTAMIEPIS